MKFKTYNLDCRDVMDMFLPDNSVDSIVTDPPYGLTSKTGTGGFMGKAWDHGVPGVEFWERAFRVLKPGGHLLAFGGPRTYHRLACAIEDAGFEIRDSCIWMFGCLDDQTQVATSEGVKPYHKTKIGDLVLCYNLESKEYSYQPILEIVEYDYSDTAYRLVGDFGEQIVSRNHRVIVERGGKEVFEYAETCEHEIRVPVLESLPALQQAVYDVQPIPSSTKPYMQQDLFRGNAVKGATWESNSVGTTQRENGSLFCLRENGLETGRMVAQGTNTDMRVPMQRGFEGYQLEGTRTQRSCKLDGSIREVIQGSHDRGVKPIMERRIDVSQPQGFICDTTDQVCSLSDTDVSNGTQGRVCDGASSSSCVGNQSTAIEDGGCTSHKPQCNGQQDRELDVIFNECASQSVRAWGGHKTTLVRVVPFHYTGKVWCLRVPTGAFVAVRNGVAFPTGNSGFPKSLDVSKAIDKAAGAEREVIRTEQNYGVTTAKDGKQAYGDYAGEWDVTAPATELAKQWAGWGTSLKPAYEPVCVARKPLIGTVVQNVLMHGVGGLNIDATRISTEAQERDNLVYRRLSYLYFSLDKICASLEQVRDCVQRIAAALRSYSTDDTCLLHGEVCQGDIQLDNALCDSLVKTLFPNGVWCGGSSWSVPDFLSGCPSCLRCGDEHIRLLREVAQGGAPSLSCALERICSGQFVPEYTHCCRGTCRLSNSGEFLLALTFSFLLGEHYTLYSSHPQKGRWPANLIHDGSAEVVALFPESKATKTAATDNRINNGGSMFIDGVHNPENSYSDSGSAARFFYVPKANKKDRNEGLDDFEKKMVGFSNGAQIHGEGYSKGQGIGLNRVTPKANTHNTVKPTDLMAYLCRLVTPPGGTVLDPFMGSGSTGKAALREGFRFIGCELEAEYHAIAEARLKAVA